MSTDEPRAVPTETEGELVARLRAGDERAFDRFAAGYLPGLYRFALRRVAGERELARDMVQATMCRVIEGLDGYRGEAPLFTWLCSCCRNEIAAHFRRLGRRPREVASGGGDGEGADSIEGVAAPEPGPEATLLALERDERVHLALDRMPATYARVVEWRYLEQLPVPEIASRLATSYKAAESLLSRARAAFRAGYAALAEGAGEPREGISGSGEVRR